jgi:hypothetical protein
MWLLFPFWINVDPTQVAEIGFRDLRFALLYVLLIVQLACAFRNWVRKRGAMSIPSGSPAGRDMTRFLAVLVVASFLLWMKMFAVYRYAIVCEFLTPVTIFLVLGSILRDPRRQLQTATACMVFLLVTLAPGHWGRRPWTGDYFDVALPALAEQRNSIVLVTGHDPVGYLIPFFPPQVRFLRIQGYLTGPSATLNRTDRLMMEAVAAHHGPLLVLFRVYEEWHALHALEFYGLEIDRSSCQSFVPGVEPQPEHPFFLCRAAPRTPR